MQIEKMGIWIWLFIALILGTSRGGHEDEVRIVTEVEMEDNSTANFDAYEEIITNYEYKPPETYEDYDDVEISDNSTNESNNHSFSIPNNDMNANISDTNKNISGTTSDAVEPNKVVNVSFEEKHVHSEKALLSLIEKGAESIIEPTLANIDLIYGGEYTVVICQLSSQNAEEFIKFRNIYLSIVGEIFDKYNKDVIFLLSKYEDHQEVSQLMAIPFINSIGVFNPKSKDARIIHNLNKMFDEEFNKIADDLEEILSTRRILSDSELDNSRIPLTPKYPR